MSERECQITWTQGHTAYLAHERCETMAHDEAIRAAQQPRPWSDATNHLVPVHDWSRSACPPGEVLTEAILERNDIATAALEQAITFQASGDLDQAEDMVRKAIRHLKGQRKLLAQEPDPVEPDPMKAAA